MAVIGIETNIFMITSSTDVITRHMNLASVRWVGATTAGDIVYVTDLGGNPIFDSVASGARFIDGWVFGRKTVDGLMFSTVLGGTGLDSGTLSFYKEPH
jgi:hypothetical protein